MESSETGRGAFSQDFKEIRIGAQLLDRPENYKALAESMTAGGDSAAARLWVGLLRMMSPQRSTVCSITSSEIWLRSPRHNYDRELPGLGRGAEALGRDRKEESDHSLRYSSFRRTREERHRHRRKRRLEAEGYEVALDLGTRRVSGELFLDKIKFTAGHTRKIIMRRRKSWSRAKPTEKNER